MSNGWRICSRRSSRREATGPGSPRRGVATGIPITRPSVARQRPPRSAAVLRCWSTRFGCGTGRHPAMPPCRGTALRVVPLAAHAHERKAAATQCYRSQIQVADADRRRCCRHSFCGDYSPSGRWCSDAREALDRILRPDLLRVGGPLAARRPVVRAAQVRDHVGAVALSALPSRIRAGLLGRCSHRTAHHALRPRHQHRHRERCAGFGAPASGRRRQTSAT